MDFKAAIIKGIQTLQETAGSEEIKKAWQDLIDLANKEQDTAKLAIMYQTFKESMHEADGTPSEPFRATVPTGHVETFLNVDEYLAVIGKKPRKKKC